MLALPPLLRRPLVALALAVALSACESGGLGPADLGARTIALEGVDGMGITGTVVITPESGGATSTVTVELFGIAPGTSHVGHVHHGSCADPGEVDLMLSPVTGDADRRGSATTTGVPNTDLQSGYAVQYHVTLEMPSPPIACADLGTPMGAGGTGEPTHDY
jgi:hypothetical protein